MSSQICCLLGSALKSSVLAAAASPTGPRLAAEDAIARRVAEPPDVKSFRRDIDIGASPFGTILTL
jgi:hypothetical protein